MVQAVRAGRSYRDVARRFRVGVATVSLWVVDVLEIAPPEGDEPVHWRLLTTHALATAGQARALSRSLPPAGGERKFL